MAGYTELDNTGYPAFANGNALRKPMIYVGANDGMLHAFNADTGVDAFSYMPAAVFPRLSRLTSQDYVMQPYVNEPVFAGDAKDGDTWRTFLIGALGRGGQGVFGLDVTKPELFNEKKQPVCSAGNSPITTTRISGSSSGRRRLPRRRPSQGKS